MDEGRAEKARKRGQRTEGWRVKQLLRKKKYVNAMDELAKTQVSYLSIVLT